MTRAPAQQMNTMLGLLAKCGGVARYTKPEGGLFIFAELNEGMDALDLLMKCVDKGVAYVHGEVDKLLKKGRVNQDKANHLKALVTGSLTKDAFSDADLRGAYGL